MKDPSSFFEAVAMARVMGGKRESVNEREQERKRRRDREVAL